MSDIQTRVAMCHGGIKGVLFAPMYPGGPKVTVIVSAAASLKEVYNAIGEVVSEEPVRPTIDIRVMGD